MGTGVLSGKPDKLLDGGDDNFCDQCTFTICSSHLTPWKHHSHSSYKRTHQAVKTLIIIPSKLNYFSLFTKILKHLTSLTAPPLPLFFSSVKTLIWWTPYFFEYSRATCIIQTNTITLVLYSAFRFADKGSLHSI